MRLNDNQFQFLNKLISSSNALLDEKPGALIFSSNDFKNKFIFIKSGEVRLIDENSIFGSKTIMKMEAPLLFGGSSLLNINVNEIIRSSKRVKFHLVDFEELDKEDLTKLKLISNSYCSYFEQIKLYKIISNTFKKDYEDISNLEELKKRFIFVKSLKETSVNDVLIYADNDFQGFSYGQILTPEVVRSFFKNKGLPRIYKFLRKENYSKELNSEINFENYFQNKPELEPQDIPSGNFLSENKNLYQRKNKRKYGITFIGGQNRFDSYISTLSMIIEIFNLPTRKDTIRKVAKIMDQDKILWSQRFLSILDNLGLSVRLVGISTEKPQRVPTPSVWISENGICSLIVNVSNKSVLVYDPLKGPTEVLFEDLSKFFGNTNQLIAVSEGLHTPKNRFKLTWLLPFIKKYKTALLEVFAASFLTQIFALATPLLFQQIIDRVISKGATEALNPMILLMLVFVVLEIIFSSLRTFQFVEVSNRIDISVGSAIISRMLKLNARFFDRKPVGEVSSRLGELENIRRFLTGTALTVVLDAFFAIIYFLVMFYYNVSLTLVVLFTLPFLFLVTVGLTPVTQRLIRGRAEAASRTQSYLVEILGGIQTVKLQNAELVSKKQWEDRHLKSINKGFNAIMANTLSSNLLQLISKISNILIIGIGASLVINNKMTLGELIAFRIISGYVTQPMLRLASTWQNFQEMSLSLERLGDVVNQPLEVSEGEEENIVMPSIKGNIQIDSVSYSYSSTSDPVLSSVSAIIKKGSFTGLVGQSGCGKSSLLKIIPRLYKPSSGRVLLDGYDISKVDLYSLREQIGFVPQDCMLFEGSIFSNIALGDPLAESEDVVKVAKIACAHEFIMTLPYGYSTPIGEKGSGLSGGQRQRIALARMILEKPNLVILDEATSALDVDTERQVVNNLRDHFQTQTLLMITHRLSTLKESDNIIVMHSGKIDSMGSHDSLMKKKGRYFALYQSQFGESD